MNERRNGEGVIVAGCVVLGLLFAVLALAVVGLFWVRPRLSSVGYEEQQATIAEEAAQEAQMSAIDEEKPILPQKMSEPEVK